MLTAGQYHTLKINRISDHGLFLIDEESEEEVLLPNRYTSLSDQVGEYKEVFIYHDSENRIIATTETPLIKAGETAYLEVVDKNLHGAFLDWGITAKDLFIPNANQLYKMEPGRKYVVYAYVDNVSGRLVATTKLNGYISNDEIVVAPRDEVDIILAQNLPMGFRVVINNRNWGMLYHNQLFRDVEIGDSLKAYVRKISEDNRIDVSLQQEGFNEVKISAGRLLKLILENGGTLGLSDSSSPEEVYSATNMSKKVFKRSLGYLLSHKYVKVENGSIEAIKQK